MSVNTAGFDPPNLPLPVFERARPPGFVRSLAFAYLLGVAGMTAGCELAELIIAPIELACEFADCSGNPEEEAAPDDHGNSIATATPVAIGATVQGVLTAWDEDYFEIPVPTDGFRLGVFTEGDTDTHGTLFDRNGVSLSSDNDSGEAFNFHIVQALDAGTYYLSISGFSFSGFFAGDTGDYSLVVEEAAPDHGNSIATATPVAIGATVQGVLTEGDEDYFEIPVPTDGFRLSVFTEGDTDTYGTLFDRNGVSLSSDNDSGEAFNFHIVQALDAGTYYLSISGFSFSGFFGDPGDYSLVVEEAAPDHGNSIATATPVAIGATVQGVLTEGDEDYFEIPVPTDGFRLSVFTEGDTDTYGTLFDRNGVSLSSDNDSGEAFNFHIVQALDAGTYYLSISGFSFSGFFAGDTGDYSLVVEEAAPDHGNSIATATPVAIGATVQGVLTEGDEDYFEIPVPTDGFRLSVFTEGDTDTYGTLFDRNGVSLSSDNDSGEAFNFHIVQALDAGTYYLSISGFSFSGFFAGDTGDYSLVVEEAAPGSRAPSDTVSPKALGKKKQSFPPDRE